MLNAEAGITLQCGDTVVRLTPTRAEIIAKEVLLQGKGVQVKLGDESLLALAEDKAQVKAATVLLKSDGAAVGLTIEAAVDGSRVLLNSPQNASDQAEESSVQTTVIELMDQAGEPIANHPYRIVLGSGEEISGTLDADGRAELILEEEGDVFFPGLPDVRAL